MTHTHVCIDPGLKCPDCDYVAPAAIPATTVPTPSPVAPPSPPEERPEGLLVVLVTPDDDRARETVERCLGWVFVKRGTGDGAWYVAPPINWVDGVQASININTPEGEEIDVEVSWPHEEQG